MSTTSRTYAYARVSSTDQDLTVQFEDLKASGVPEQLIFAEKKSGTSRDGREELERLLRIVVPGDVIHVTRIDRLARSMVDFANIAADLKKRGVGLKVIKQNIDTTAGGAVGELTMNLLAAFASFETAIRRERQLEGIARAKLRGVYRGRQRGISAVAIKDVLATGLGPSAAARKLGISRASLYRVLGEAGDAAPK